MRASSGATGRPGRPTRTARSSTCWRRRSPRGPARTPASTTARSRHSTAAVYTRIDTPATPEQKAPLEQLTPEAVKATELAGEPIIGQADPRPGQRRRRSAASRSSPRAAGSRPGPRARRTSTRSMRRASGTRATSTPSWQKRSGSWPRRSAADAGSISIGVPIIGDASQEIT